MKKGSSKKTLKALKEEAQLSLEKEDYTLFLSTCEEIKKMYPKNAYGYTGYIIAVTNNYKTYVGEDVLKDLKKDFEKAYQLTKKNDKEVLKRNFDEYVNDHREVENLKKNRKELISKYFLKGLYNDGISFINQNINLANSYNLNGKKIINIYDLLNGIFLLTCLIFNLVHRNYLLFITIPFGIFGIITIYSFINMNFFGKRKLSSEKKYLLKIVEEANLKIKEAKKEITKIEESIEFLKKQKSEILLKIPESFTSGIENVVLDDEESVALKILDELINNNISSFTYLINEQTSLDIDEIILKIKPQIKDEKSELINFISDKIAEKKSNQNEFISMKKIKTFNYAMIGVLLAISICSIIVLINNFYEINFASFVAAIIIGVLSMFIYNINTGKHSSLTDTFNDSLMSTVFASSLVYDLIYMSITNELKFTYGFIEMPIIFILIFMGFVALISLFKYKNLMAKLRGE